MPIANHTNKVPVVWGEELEALLLSGGEDGVSEKIRHQKLIERGSYQPLSLKISFYMQFITVCGTLTNFTEIVISSVAVIIGPFVIVVTYELHVNAARAKKIGGIASPKCFQNFLISGLI